jgi:ligand-binding sensor domain-containing protein
VRALDPGKPLGEYRRQTWQVDSGLPQNTVHAVLQTRDGFVWMATESGLVRFDGVEFRTFDTANTPELHSNLVDDLFEDRDGALWISTSDGLVRRQHERFTAFSTEQGLPSNAVMRVAQQRGGSLIVVTAAGLAMGDGERFRAIPGTEAVARDEHVVLLADDSHGTLWTAAGAQLIAVRAGSAVAERPTPTQVGTIQAIALSGSGDVWVGGTRGAQCLCLDKLRGGPARLLLPSHTITALLAERQPNHAGDMWIGTTAGIAFFSNGAVKEVGVQEGLSGADVHKLFEDRSGALWVMYGRGLARVVNGHAEIAPPETSVADVLAVSEDSEGDLWFGSGSAGASVLRDQMFSSLTTHEGPAADYIRTVFQDRSGTIWLGTNGAGLRSFSGGKLSAFRNQPKMSSSVVLALAQTGDDLWVGTSDGLTRIRNGATQLFTSTDGLADNFVRSLYADTDGSLWIGTRNGLSHFKDGKFRSYFSQDGLGNDVIGSVLRTRAGELWVATLGGLSRLAGESFANYTKRNGLGGDAVTALFEDGDGSLWIGTNGSGLNRLRGGRLTWFAPQKTATPETVYGILDDRAGNLWLSSQRGVYRVSIAGLNGYADKGSGEISVANFGAPDGMRISECSSGGHPAAWRMADGSLWFATPRGVAWVNPQARSGPAQPPQVAIEQVSVDNQVRELAGTQGVPEIDVPAGRERLAIHYSGLSFRAPQKVRYRYRLEHFDRAWVEAGTSRTAYYTNVPPGRYRFSIMAAGADGVWGSPSSVDFQVQPRFFETRWFYFLVGAAVLGIGYMTYRVRVRFVEATYKAVMAERGRIAREVHDTLAQGYVGISVHLEIASRMLETGDGSREAALAQVNETKELVRSGLAEARSSIWDLRSAGDEADALPSRLAAAARQKTSGGGPALAFNVHGTYRPLPRRVEDEVLRIAVEAVTNAVRHAHATNIGVTLTYDAKTFMLSVSDDGRGFSASQETLADGGHFGVKGMHERAEAIDAVLQIEQRPAGGTEVTLTLNALHAAGKDRA